MKGNNCLIIYLYSCIHMCLYSLTYSCMCDPMSAYALASLCGHLLGRLPAALTADVAKQKHLGDGMKQACAEEYTKLS